MFIFLKDKDVVIKVSDIRYVQSVFGQTVVYLSGRYSIRVPDTPDEFYTKYSLDKFRFIRLTNLTGQLTLIRLGDIKRVYSLSNKTLVLTSFGITLKTEGTVSDFITKYLQDNPKPEKKANISAKKYHSMEAYLKASLEKIKKIEDALRFEYEHLTDRIADIDAIGGLHRDWDRSEFVARKEALQSFAIESDLTEAIYPNGSEKSVQ